MRFVGGRPSDLSANDLLPVPPPVALARREQGFQARFDDGTEIEFSTVIPSGTPHLEDNEITFSDDLSVGYCTENLARHTNRTYVHAIVRQRSRAIAEFMYGLSQRTRALIVVFGTNGNRFMYAGVTTYQDQKEDLASDWERYSVLHCASSEELFQLFSGDFAGLRRYRGILSAKRNIKIFALVVTGPQPWRFTRTLNNSPANSPKQ